MHQREIGAQRGLEQIALSVHLESLLTLLDNSPHAGRREDPAKPEATSTNALDECSLWHKIDRHLPIDHLLLRLRIQADVACYRFFDQARAHQLTDSPARGCRVVGDDS